MEKEFKQAVNTYNKIAKLYADYTYTKLMQFQLTKFISLLKGKKVLDAGCGGGRDVEYFKEEGLSVLGIDISEEMIKEAKKRVSGARFEVMDFSDIKLKDSTVDGVWCMAGFLHTPRDEIVKVLKEFFRVLKKEGVVYVAVREGVGEKEIRKEKYGNEPRTYVYFSKEELVGYLEEAGFSIVEAEVNDDGGKKWVEIFGEKS